MNSRRSANGSGVPRQSTRPSSSGSRPATASSKVVLPAPFGPMRPTISPAGTEKDTSARAHCSPYRLASAITCTRTGAASAMRGVAVNTVIRSTTLFEEKA